MYLFHIPGMRCGACAATVARTIKTVDPRAVVQIDPHKREVEVTSWSSEAALVAALKDAGYPAEPILQHIE